MKYLEISWTYFKIRICLKPPISLCKTKGYVTSENSWWHETRAGMNSFWSPCKPHILYTRVWQHEISCWHNFMSVLRTCMKFHAGMKEKNVHIMSRKYDSQSVRNMITVLRWWWHENFPLICVFSCQKWWNEKKNGFEEKSEYTVSFFFIPWKFFWKIGQLAPILWNRVLIMLLRGKEFRKHLAATETAAEINEDYFTFSSPSKYDLPSSKQQKKTKIDKEKWFRWTTDMVEDLIPCLAEQKSLYEFKGLDFEADLVQLYTPI